MWIKTTVGGETKLLNLDYYRAIAILPSNYGTSWQLCIGKSGAVRERIGVYTDSDTALAAYDAICGALEAKAGCHKVSSDF